MADTGLLGPILDRGVNAIGNAIFGDPADKERKLQVAFAKNAIQWKTADALKAGVHPLYALGAPTTSYSPVSVGGGGYSDVSSMGQDIGRAVGAGIPREGQLSAFDSAVQELTLKKFGLENELLASQIARMNQDTLSKPAIPSVTLPSGAGRVVPGQSSKAQVVQDEYGDIVENGYGLWRLLNDLGKGMVGPGRGVKPKGPALPTSYNYSKTGRR